MFTPKKGSGPFFIAVIAMVALGPGRALAWNATGHQIVAGIAWDNLTPTARQKIIAVLNAAPSDACLLDLFPTDARPIEVRTREFFMLAATWPDVVRPQGNNDTRPCVRFHRRDWHFINFFWQGISGETNQNRPKDRTDIPVPEMNAVDRLTYFRPFVACNQPACGSTAAERATTLAWILHLAGDIHQPLHTSARARPGEQTGDQGGNLFILRPDPDKLTLHLYWDNIVDLAMPRGPSESMSAYLDRAAGAIVTAHPRSGMVSRLESGKFDVWVREGFVITKNQVYPKTLLQNVMPSNTYRDSAMTLAKERIALGAYRLADLLMLMFGP